VGGLGPQQKQERRGGQVISSPKKKKPVEKKRTGSANVLKHGRHSGAIGGGNAQGKKKNLVRSNE